MKTQTTRRRTPPLPLLPALALLVFAAGLLAGWTGASALTLRDQGPSFTPGPAPAQSAPPLPPPTPIPSPDRPSTAEGDWALVLVNGDHPLPERFTVPGLTQLRNGHAIDQRAYPALQAMMDGCRAAGLSPTICSSYRSQEKQEQLYQNKVDRLAAQGWSLEEAKVEAAKSVAIPGTSEHQLGLAVDIVDKHSQVLDNSQADTPAQQWLMEHSWEYGFILRYPEGKSEITGIIYEPWHYRYVGKEAAAEIHELGLCLEEYLAQEA